VLQYVCDFRDAFIFQCLEGVDFRGSSDVFMVIIMVLDAFGAKWFDTCGGRAEVREGFSFMLHTCVFYEFGGEFGCVKIGVVAIFHLNLTNINDKHKLSHTKNKCVLYHSRHSNSSLDIGFSFELNKLHKLRKLTVRKDG